MFYTWGCLDTPTFVCPHMFVCPIHLYAPRVYTPLYAPILFYASVFLELYMLWEGCNGLPFVLGHPPLHHPCLGCIPFITLPHLVIGSLCISMFQGYQYVMWAFPFCQEGFGGVSHQLGGWGHQHLRCPFAHFCTFL